MKKYLKLEIILWIDFLICFQVSGYYLVKCFNMTPNLINSVFDNYIPFIPEFIYFYVFWYLMLFFIPYLLYFKDRKTFFKYSIALIICAFIGTIIFIIYPTIIIRAEFDPVTISEKLVWLIYEADTPAINCFPSFHCILCLLFIMAVIKNKKIKLSLRLSVEIISCLIILSTLFIKQHVIYDFVGALILVLSVWFIVCKLKLGENLHNYLIILKRKVVKK